MKVPTIVAELMGGSRHSRQTIAKATGRSVGTADRWIAHVAAVVPGARKVREGRTTWLIVDTKREPPTRLATLGACFAESFASMFEGSGHERNLKDARDYILRARGEQLGDLDRKVVFAPRGGEYALPEAAGELVEILDGVLGARELKFRYRHSNGEAASLAVHPLSLVIFEHQFYVLCRERDGSLYCYRFARMSDVEATTMTFTYPSKNEYEPRRILDAGFGIHVSVTAPVEDVEVILSGAWASTRKRIGGTRGRC